MTAAQQPALPGFVRVQQAFTAFVRDPEAHEPPQDIEPRRMAVYRDIMYANVESIFSGAFPVVRYLLGEERWHALVHDYFAEHRAKTPLFPQLPLELVNYLQNERGPRPGDFAFLAELAHYEWVELALGIAEDEIDGAAVDPDGDLLDGMPVLSPLAWPLAYRFAVHRISSKFLPDSPGEQPTYLVVYRDASERIGFLELNPVTARLLALIMEGGARAARDLLSQIAQELKHPDPDVVIAGGAQVMQDWRRRGVLAGTARRT